MSLFPPLVNGRSFAYVDISITILGIPVNSTSSINYEGVQEKSNNFGIGVNPVSRGKGSRDYSGSITLSLNDSQVLRDAVKASNPTSNGDLCDIPAFDISITYGVTAIDSVNHVLKNVEFTSEGVDANQGDMDLVKSHDLVISHVVY